MSELSSVSIHLFLAVMSIPGVEIWLLWKRSLLRYDSKCFLHFELIYIYIYIEHAMICIHAAFKLGTSDGYKFKHQQPRCRALLQLGFPDSWMKESWLNLGLVIPFASQGN